MGKIIKLMAAPKPLKIIPPPDFRFVPSKGKQPTQKDGVPYDEVQHLDAYCALVPDGYVMLDFDHEPHISIVRRIIAEERLKTRVMETDRGIHVWFKSATPLKNFVNKPLAAGVNADCRSFGKNSYACWKINGIERKWSQETPWDQIEMLPAYFRPGTDKTKPFHDYHEGDGRNTALSEYIWSLQHHQFTRDEIVSTFKVINQYVFPEPLPISELATILREDTFKEETGGEIPWFTEKGQFLHNEMAQYLMTQHDFMYVNDTLYQYRDGYYQRIEENYIEHLVYMEYPESSIRQRAEVKGSLKANLYNERLPYQSMYELCVANGRLNLRTGELHPHSPDAYDFQQIPTRWREGAESSILDATLHKLFPDPAALELFEEMVGYTLLKGLPYRCAFYLLGDGANGKSTLLNMIKDLLGEVNCSALVPDQLTTDSFSLPELENKLANIGDDIGNGRITDTSTFKKVTTGEGILVSRKYQQPFTLYNYATMIFAANDLPTVSDHSYGASSRRIIIPLAARFTADDPDFDPFIGDKLKASDTMEALLQRAYKGLRRLMERNQFTMPEEVKEAERSFVLVNTYVGQWIEDQMITEDELRGRDVSEVRKEYRQWLVDNGLKSNVSPVSFGKTMSQIYPRLKTKSGRVDGEVVRVYA